MNRAPDTLRDACIDAARRAASHAAEHKRRRGEIHRKFSHDVKLKLDHECQQKAFDAIHARFPDDALLGEEGSRENPGEYEWVVDPIDGTVNFFHGVPWWCSSVAVRRKGRVLAAAVYGPEQDMLFDAHIDAPARLNGAAVRTSEIRLLADAMFVTGSEKEMAPGKLPLATAQAVAPHVQKVRILGAAALDICQVASGAVDIFCQKGLYIWDIAAAGLIVERAGGVYRQTATDVADRYLAFASANAELAAEFDRTIHAI